MSNYDLRDAFQELVALNEAEEFNLSDEEQIKKMADFMDGDEYDEVQMVIDVDAEGMDELEPSYEGKIILQCPVCKSLIYKDEADIVKDSSSDYVNVEEHCPYCKEEGGMIIVGKVAPYPTHEEEKVEEPAEDSAEEPVESEEETEVETEEPVQESLTEEVGVQKFGDEDDPERYHSANWYIGGRNNFELSTDALGGAKRGDAVRYTASRWSHTYHNTQEMEDDIKNLQTLIAEVKKLEAKGFVNSELNESLKEDLTVDEQAKVNEIVDQFLRDACAEIAVRDIDYKKENILKAVQAFVDDFFFMSESLNEDVNGELAMAELKDLVAMHIYNRFLESLDDNMAQEIAHRIPEYDVDWCNEEGDNFLANTIETKKKALARAITDALFANAPRELPECLTESDMPAEESENIVYRDSRRGGFYLWRNGKRYEAETIEKLKEILKSKDEDCKLKEGEVCPKCGKSPCECKECADTKLTEASEVIDRKGFATLIKYSDPVFANASHGVLNDGNFCYKFWAKDDDEAKKIFAERGVECDKSLKESIKGELDYDEAVDFVEDAGISLDVAGSDFADYIIDDFEALEDESGKFSKADLKKFIAYAKKKAKEFEDEDLYEDLDTESLDKLISEKLGKTYVTESGYVDGKKIMLEGTLEGQPTQFTFKAKQHKGGLSLISEQFVIKGHVENKNIICEDIADSFKEIADGLEEVTGQIRQAADDVEFEAEQVRVGAEEIEGNEKFEGLKEATKMSKIEGTTVCEDLQDALDAVRTAETELEKEIANKQLKNQTFQKAYKAAHADECLDEGKNPNFDEEKYGKYFTQDAKGNYKLIPEKADEYFDLLVKLWKEQDDKEVNEAFFINPTSLDGYEHGCVIKDDDGEYKFVTSHDEAHPVALFDTKEAAEEVAKKLADQHTASKFPVVAESLLHEAKKVSSIVMYTLEDSDKDFFSDIIRQHYSGELKGETPNKVEVDDTGIRVYTDKSNIYYFGPKFAGGTATAEKIIDYLTKHTLEESVLTEKKWEVRLESGKALRQAIDGEDGEEIKEALKNCYKEINRKMPEEFDEDELESMLDDLDMADFSENEEVGVDAEEAEDNVNAYLGDFYDFCDGYNIWVEI